MNKLKIIAIVLFLCSCNSNTQSNNTKLNGVNKVNIYKIFQNDSLYPISGEEFNGFGDGTSVEIDSHLAKSISEKGNLYFHLPLLYHYKRRFKNVIICFLSTADGEAGMILLIINREGNIINHKQLAFPFLGTGAVFIDKNLYITPQTSGFKLSKSNELIVKYPICINSMLEPSTYKDCDTIIRTYKISDSGMIKKISEKGDLETFNKYASDGVNW